MLKVVIESPYAGDVERNVKYARACIMDSLLRGESPLASHLLYTQEGMLNDDIPEQRTIGINAGLRWLNDADLHVFYIDYGVTDGMMIAYHKSKKLGKKVEFRRLYDVDY